jgi:hypothetical protein
MIHTKAAAIRSTCICAILALLILPSLSGCAIFAQVLNAAAPAIKPPVYKNLAGQSVTVMVWAEDQGVKIDYPRIQLDVAQMVISQLQQHQKEDKPDELKFTRFPVSAGSVARFQEEHTELAADSIEDIAPRLGTSRVIYIEIRGFQTHSDVSNDLFRGVIRGSVSVVEVTNGKGRVIPVDETLKIKYPRTSPDEGLPNVGDFAIYNGTLKGFATEVAKLFVPHADDPDADYGAVSAATTPDDEK